MTISSIIGNVNRNHEAMECYAAIGLHCFMQAGYEHAGLVEHAVAEMLEVAQLEAILDYIERHRVAQA